MPDAAKKEYTFGTCAIGRVSPAREKLTASTKVLNLNLSFEEALKLNLAIDECCRKLNSYKKSTKEGKRAALNLTIHLELSRVAVNEGKL